MKILVTGGAGYLGSVLVPTLLAKGHMVTVLDSFLFRQNSLMDCCQYEQFQVVRGDCRDESVVKPLVEKSDVIIPLAALVGAPLCDQDRVAAETTNRDAVRMLCRFASKDQRSSIQPPTVGMELAKPASSVLKRRIFIRSHSTVLQRWKQKKLSLNGINRSPSGWRPYSACRPECDWICWSMILFIAR